MPYSTSKAGRRRRQGGIITSQTRSTADLESRQYTESLEKLCDEERKSMARIQNDLYDVKQKLKTSLADQSQSVLSVDVIDTGNTAAGDTENKGEEPEETSAKFLPGMMYHNNGSLRTPTRKFKSLSNAHNQLLRQLKESQCTFHKSLKKASENSSSKLQVVNAIPSSISTTMSRNDLNGRADQKRKILLDGKSHSCRGMAGDAVFVPDCKLCTKLMNKRIQSLAQSQAAAIGNSVTLSAESYSNSCQNSNKVWLPAPRGKWYTKEESFLEAKNNVEKLPAHSTDSVRDKVILKHKMALNRMQQGNRTVQEKSTIQLSMYPSNTPRQQRHERGDVTGRVRIQDSKSNTAQRSRVQFQETEDQTDGQEMERPKSVLEDRSVTQSGHWELKNHNLSGAYSSPQFHKTKPSRTKTRSTKTMRAASKDSSSLNGIFSYNNSKGRRQQLTDSPRNKSAERLTRSLQIIEQMKQREKEHEEHIRKRIQNFLADIDQFVSSI